MVKPSHGQVHQQKLQPKLPENCKEKPTNNHGHTGLAEKKKKEGHLKNNRLHGPQMKTTTALMPQSSLFTIC